MKKILFATTALVATAGVASADVSLSGSAEMGIIGGSVDDDALETQFHTDIDVTFTMTGESDNGISFGANVDLDESDSDASCETRTAGVDLNGGGIVGVNDDYSLCDEDLGSPAFGNTTQGGESIFVSAGGATLTMGDTDGALDRVMKEVNVAAGSINDDETAHAGFNGNSNFDGTYDGQIARFDYTFSGFVGSISAEIDDSGDNDPVLGVGVRYNAEFAGLDLGVGLGYQAVEDDSAIGVSVDTTLSNGLLMAVNYTKYDFDGTDGSHAGIGLGYEMNALAIGVNYGVYQLDGDTIQSGAGIAASYDLGGGLEAQFGYGGSNISADGTGTGDDLDSDTWSLGLAMSF